MDNQSTDQDSQKQGVIEEVGEDVELARLELPGVDFVEDLQQDEHVEKDRVVLSGLIIPVLVANSDRGRDVEDLGACVMIDVYL